MGTLAKKLGKKAREEAKRTSRQVSEELAGIPKDIVRQAVGTPKDKSPIVEAMLQKSVDSSSDSGKLDGKKDKQSLDYLQKELEKLRTEKKLEEQNAAQETTSAPIEEKPEPLEEPTPKHKIGLPQFGQKGKNKGTGEMIKSRK